jgi:hypothetical protein
MAHKYNLNLIKARGSYSIKEICLLLKINRKTCSLWIKKGLEVIESNAGPLLVMGESLKRFIKEMRLSRKIPLKDDEFFCFRCHKAVVARTGSYTVIKTGKTIGKNALDQIQAVGRCQICGTDVKRFLKVCQKD